MSTGTSPRIRSASSPQLSGKTRTSEDPEKSSTVNRANSAPDRLLICRFTAVTTTPSAIGSGVHVPSWLTVCVANSSHSTRNGSSGWPLM